MSTFDWPVRVYYEDTDGGGVVYHANYLKFMERARTEWLRSLGFDQIELRRESGVIFVVRQIAIQYRRSALFDDALIVRTSLARTGRSLLVFNQTICRDETVLIEATVEVACVSAAEYRPVSIPSAVRQAMQNLVIST
ncbi:MAG TPA: tol-pal system-associated acyl-CoA thioesterase [Methylophilaceae bacterium]|jgi:acyl-CoA thioester hydrolase